MRPVHAQSSGSEALLRIRSSADCTIDTHESKFSEATEVPMAILELLLLAMLSVWAVAICLRCAIVVHSLAKQRSSTQCDGDIAHFA